jgi:hypothetical protein
MITLKDSIKIKATPVEVYEWLIQRFRDKKSYQAWHPDHVDVSWIKGQPLREGSILYAEEYLHGDLHKLKFRITKIVPNKELEYKPLFPLSIFIPKNQFFIESTGVNSCIFTATGSLRAGPLFKILGKKRLNAIKQHMKEEGKNLKKLLEDK